ncbi:MAG: hypothetical protein HN644_09390 [Rhodospirillales bacterium]|jgi:hypothetical protein|nr:hypothetical protein [Rhodospirillales bacterium]MBT4038668.1 hypothetical protein [Rhodospirillales bacterium]MBT4628506.1 hypothetical protein [Rhodospirillales bacterium]MBT5350435.1 hypothetical protein [Rhodospirillales bacterium]MBT5520042.1 hypothetical protein [Rhodospirillales bacterium]
MKLITALKNFVAPSAAADLAKFDAHLLADMGFNTTNARTAVIRTPLEAGVRLA